MRRYIATAGVIACAAAAVAAVASAEPRASTKYEGTTSQGNSVALRTNATGGSVKGFRIRRELNCATDSGDQTVIGDFRTRGPMVIRQDGRFGASAKVTPVGGGSIARGVFTLRGRFGPRGRAARGTYRERVRLDNGTRCDTGEVRYRVSLPAKNEALQL